MENENCYFCLKENDEIVPAKYDSRTKFGGSWAYMCEKHFKVYGFGLGIGKEQNITEDQKTVQQ